MKRKIFLFSALLAGLSVLVTSILITFAAYQDFSRTMQLEVRATASYLHRSMEQYGAAYLDDLQLQRGHRVTIIAADGSVLYDSKADSSSMDNHKDRPEVQAALQSGRGESTRFSDTLREQTYYYALRLSDGSVFRMASASSSVITSYDRLFWVVTLVVIGGFMFSAAIASFVTRKIVSPINQIDLDHPEQHAAYDEIVPLLSRIQKQRTQISKQMEALSRQRAEFTAITEHMNEGLLILDGDGTVLTYNKSALRLLASRAKDPVGQNVLTLNRNEAVRDAVHHAMEGESLSCVTELGGRQCQLLVSPVKQGDAVSGIIVIIMDVTEKQEREKLRREFTANVSHELKTPLTAISGYAEIMMNGLANLEDIPEFSQSIYGEAQRLIALVQDLMFLSKLEEGSSPVKEPVKLLALSQEVAASLAPRATRLGVTLSVNGDEAELFGIPTVLREMVYNLLDNAIKYNQKGGNAAITITAQEKQIILQVSDTGIGIPKAEQARVFERFYRVEKSHNRAIEGTGLGLAIVKHGALLHEAEIHLESGSEGTSFTIRFPTKKAPLQG